ncbi:phenylacetic acid degradation protein [Taibaiella sp. KBW10]|uniref:2Fe-2S iron-sulfur cluster-binding protein n=1 Tax=Taibaiella sp. KBW10 TaxID=2153357 RepID=UPI000F5AC495|nr:2Fe-2S iron-sulfur cluster-binding protein [Taibaiella sp. KBW10]RQO32464.1 phenylacetic acid degradation protein [Taibaiella sp. KBW10]
MSTLQFHDLTVKDIRQETADCVSIAFDVPEAIKSAFDYLPGQYLTFKTFIEGNEVRRSYSICSGKSDRELRVAVKRVMPQGKFSSWANEVLKVGDTVSTMPPMGKFTPKKSEKTQRNYLAFAAGSGITPIMSIMKAVLHEEEESTFTLVFGNYNRNSIIFKEELEALKNRFMHRLRLFHVFDREMQEAELFNGMITVDKVKTFGQKLINFNTIDDIFICGPEPMILALKDYFLNELKKPEDSVYFELFSSPDQPKTLNKDWEAKQQQVDRSKLSKVTVRLDGASFDMDLAYGGENILDAALQHGGDLPYACKGGVCCTCKAKLISGEVDMEVNYGLEPDEIANNFILTCQAHPRSETVVIDFDTK